MSPSNPMATLGTFCSLPRERVVRCRIKTIRLFNKGERKGLQSSSCSSQSSFKHVHQHKFSFEKRCPPIRTKEGTDRGSVSITRNKRCGWGQGGGVWKEKKKLRTNVSSGSRGCHFFYKGSALKVVLVALETMVHWGSHLFYWNLDISPQLCLEALNIHLSSVSCSHLLNNRRRQ